MYYLESSCCCLAVVPQVPTRRDKRKCSDGQMEENRVKYAFFLICLFFVLAQGSRQKKKILLTSWTCDGYAAPDNRCLVGSQPLIICLFVRNRLPHACCFFAFFVRMVLDFISLMML